MPQWIIRWNRNWNLKWRLELHGAVCGVQELRYTVDNVLSHYGSVSSLPVTQYKVGLANSLSGFGLCGLGVQDYCVQGLRRLVSFAFTCFCALILVGRCWSSLTFSKIISEYQEPSNVDSCIYIFICTNVRR